MQNGLRRASTKIILLLCLQLLVAGSNLAFVMYHSRLLGDDARIINLSGVVRGSIQRAVKLRLLGESPAQVAAQVDALLADFRSQRPGYALPGAGRAYYDRLDHLERSWTELKGEVTASGPITPEGRKRLFRQSEAVWGASNEVVVRAQDISRTKLQRMGLGYLFAVVQLLLMLALIWLVYSLVRGRLEPQASIDALTGLANRRIFEEMLPRAAAVARRYGTPLALIAFDLDHFKRVNDTYGHAAGDEVLRRMARVVSGSIRGSDLLCRVGGEEFSILCPHTPVL
ncbi:MAG: diguanylate cyclase, partial [Desulfovibrionaceae bacterium]